MKELIGSSTSQIIQMICIGFFVAIVMSSCRGIGELNDSSLSSQTSSSDCRILNHALGETCVPISPKQIVVLDDCTLEPVLALGIQPIGGSIQGVTIPGQRDLSHIQDIGSPPNLEKILALKPDLILGCAYLRDIYNQAAQIAPTVIAPIETSSDWKAVFFLVADALGEIDAAEQVMDDYNTRLAILRSQLGDSPDSIQVSVIRIYPDRITLYAREIFIGTILEDAGLSRPLSQNQNVPIIDISKERIQDADGDVIFFWTYGSNEQLKESAKTALTKLQTLHQTWSDQTNLEIREVGCLWTCSQPCAVAFSAPGKATYLFTQIPVTESAALLQFGKLYLNSKKGTIPWKQFPEELQSVSIAKIPSNLDRDD